MTKGRTANALNLVAVTGTPGTGKSATTRLLHSKYRVEEVGALARRLGAARGRPRHLEVDVRRLGRELGRLPPSPRPMLVVGHLSHLLPVREAIVLRCHPLELRRRLDRARRGTRAERRENVAAEATDVVLLEALGLGRRVWEFDTTASPPAESARRLDSIVRRRPKPRVGTVDWLADPRVTDYLLRGDQ